MPSFKISKSELLSNKNRLSNLFESGKVVKAFPFKIIYISEKTTAHFPQVQFAFSIPKRSFKKAVDRNFLKRRIKEAFRLHKHKIYDALVKDQSIYGIIIYIDKEKRDFHSIKKAYDKASIKLIASALLDS